MSKFNEGDRVVANKSIVATVRVYDEQTGRVVLEQELGGGATNLIYGPIASYDLELLVSEAVTSRPDETVVEPGVVVDEGPQDEYTTLDTLS